MQQSTTAYQGPHQPAAISNNLLHSNLQHQRIPAYERVNIPPSMGEREERMFWGHKIKELEIHLWSDAHPKPNLFDVERSFHVSGAKVLGYYLMKKETFYLPVILNFQGEDFEICVLTNNYPEVSLDLNIQKGERIAFYKEGKLKHDSAFEVQLTGYYLDRKEDTEIMQEIMKEKCRRVVPKQSTVVAPDARLISRDTRSAEPTVADTSATHD